MDDIRQFILREPKSTDKKLDFNTYHDLVMAVARNLGIDISRDPTIQPILLMELDEDLPVYDEEAEKDATSGNMPYIDKKGTVLYFDSTSQTWKRDESQQKVTLCNFTKGYYAKKGRFLFRYLQQAAKFVPCSDSPRVAGILLADLDTNDTSAEAKMTVWTPGSAFAETDPKREITVYPCFNSQLGYILEGMKVEAEFTESGYRVARGGKAKLLTVTADKAFVATDTSVDVHITDWDDGEDPDPEDAGISCLNELGFYGEKDLKMYAEYMPQGDKYRLYQEACPEEA